MKTETRVVCVGPRDWSDEAVCASFIRRIHAWNPEAIIVSGGASGADSFWAGKAREVGLRLEVVRPQWKVCHCPDSCNYCHGSCVDKGAEICKCAGFVRSRAMVQLPGVIGVLACSRSADSFSPGTRASVDEAKSRRIPVWPVLSSSPPSGKGARLFAEIPDDIAQRAEASNMTVQQYHSATRNPSRANRPSSIPEAKAKPVTPSNWYCHTCRQLVDSGKKCLAGFYRDHDNDEVLSSIVAPPQRTQAQMMIRSAKSFDEIVFLLQEHRAQLQTLDYTPAADAGNELEEDWWSEEGIDYQNGPDQLWPSVRLGHLENLQYSDRGRAVDHVGQGASSTFRNGQPFSKRRGNVTATLK